MAFDKARRMFSDHPASVGETYFEHMGQAFRFSAAMAVAAIACFLHGFLPFAFTRTGSRTIADLHDRMVANRSRQTRGTADAESRRQLSDADAEYAGWQI
jgi:hypothetical protein